MNVFPADASTVVLLRPCADEGMELLLVRRHRKSSFVPGYYVFPGGGVDKEDYARETERFIQGIDRPSAARILTDMSHPDKALGAWVAGVRETFEEVGLLLAQTKDGKAVAIRTPEEQRRFTAYRCELNAGKMTFFQMLAEENLVLPLQHLHYFSHWITPVGFPLRYDVRFFVALAPADQVVSHDGIELTHSVWVRPKEALRQYREGLLDMVLPQIMTIEDIARFQTPRQVIEAARSRHIPATLTKMMHIDGRDVEVMPDGTIYENRPPVYSWPEEE